MEKESRNYNTKQRGEILSCLMENSASHITAEELILMLSQKGVRIGKATVYRSLSRLEEDGVIKKYISEEGKSACWQYAVNGQVCQEHFHLHCVKCHRLFHLECSFMEEIASHIYNEHKFTVDCGRTVFYGICEECGAKEND